MLGNKKGGIAALIIGEMRKKKAGNEGGGGGDWSKGKPGMMDDSEDGDEGESMAAEEATMGELIDAIKQGDRAAALEAFRSLHESC